MALPRDLLADDHTVVVEALRKLLECHFEVVATVSDGCALLEIELNPVQWRPSRHDSGRTTR
jgi:DNA-binding NarL/FixJ family response regulator